MIFHRPDSATCPTVDFMPFAEAPFDITDTMATDINEPDPALTLLPDKFTLYQNFPNPFNSLTRIEFSIHTADAVSLIIYNVVGQKVITLADGYYRAGLYHFDWDGQDEMGHAVASGIYFYGLMTEDKIEFRKLLLIK